MQIAFNISHFSSIRVGHPHHIIVVVVITIIIVVVIVVVRKTALHKVHRRARRPRRIHRYPFLTRIVFLAVHEGGAKSTTCLTGSIVAIAITYGKDE